MEKLIDYSILNAGEGPIDAKTTVGASYSPFSSISEIPEQFKSEGLLVYDVTNGIHWEFYKNSDGDYKHRPFDGILHVKGIQDATGGSNPTDGVSYTEGDKFLYLSSVPQFSGLYRHTSDAPTINGLESNALRLTAFDTISDSLSNVLIKVDNGDKWKDSIWSYTTVGDNFIQTDFLTDNITPPEDYSDFQGYYWGRNVGNEFIHNLALLSSDSWHVFQPSNGSYPPITVSEDYQISMLEPIIYASTSDAGVTINYFSSLIPNKDYVLTKQDSGNYAAFASDTLTDCFPQALITRQGESCSVKMYHENGGDNTFFFSGGKELSLISTTTTSDGALSDIVLPAGYNIFSIKGSVSGGTANAFSLGTTPDASDIYSSDSSIVLENSESYSIAFGKLDTDWTTYKTLYLKSSIGWTTDTSTDVTLEFCLYKDSY